MIKEILLRTWKKLKKIIKTETNVCDFKTCLFSEKQEIYIKWCIVYLNRQKHEINTILWNKLALNNKYHKRVICRNKIDTLPYGHYKLKDENDVIW